MERSGASHAGSAPDPPLAGTALSFRVPRRARSTSPIHHDPLSAARFNFRHRTSSPCSRDAVGNPVATFTGETVTNNTDDNTPPAVTGIEFTSDPGDDGYYVANDVIQAKVTFSEAVTVSGAPRLTLAIGIGSNAPRSAAYGSTHSSGADVVFTYAVVAGDFDSNGISTPTNPLTLNNGSIRDAANNDADRKVDAVAPEFAHIERFDPVSSPTNANRLAWLVYFDEDVDHVDATDFTVNGTSAAIAVDQDARPGHRGQQIEKRSVSFRSRSILCAGSVSQDHPPGGFLLSGLVTRRLPRQNDGCYSAVRSSRPTGKSVCDKGRTHVPPRNPSLTLDLCSSSPSSSCLPRHSASLGSRYDSPVTSDSHATYSWTSYQPT